MNGPAYQLLSLRTSHMKEDCLVPHLPLQIGNMGLCNWKRVALATVDWLPSSLLYRCMVVPCCTLFVCL